MSTDLVWLALLMGAVTYPSRALPLLMPGVERLPRWVLDYLRLVGPAVLAALAAVNVMVASGTDGRASLHVGVEWLAVLLCVAVVAWRRNLLLGILAAVLLTAAARAIGLAALP
ncbi:MAG TPA: AzlD domain-containing protein [Candidatus Dormibacteraeota bacterium]|nr:AzlD domain-containing protein [Candidatus Dormibacteraeota bacterium]